MSERLLTNGSIKNGMSALIQGVPKKGINKKLSIGAAHDINSVLEFIWIQYIFNFCLVYHLKDLDASG